MHGGQQPQPRQLHLTFPGQEPPSRQPAALCDAPALNASQGAKRLQALCDKTVSDAANAAAAGIADAAGQAGVAEAAVAEATSRLQEQPLQTATVAEAAVAGVATAAVQKKPACGGGGAALGDIIKKIVAARQVLREDRGQALGNFF